MPDLKDERQEGQNESTPNAIGNELSNGDRILFDQEKTLRHIMIPTNIHSDQRQVPRFDELAL